MRADFDVIDSAAENETLVTDLRRNFISKCNDLAKIQTWSEQRYNDWKKYIT